MNRWINNIQITNILTIVFCVVLLCVLTFRVLWFPHKTMFGSSLPPVVCRRARVLFTLFVHSGVQHILCCGFALFVFVLFMLPVSLDCPFFLLPFRYSLTFIKCFIVNLYSHSNSGHRLEFSQTWLYKPNLLLHY